MLESLQKRQCNMKIEDERVCVTVSTVRREQQDQISAENGCCMKLETSALLCPRGLGVF